MNESYSPQPQERSVGFQTVFGTLMGAMGAITAAGVGNSTGDFLGRTFNINRLIRDDNWQYDTLVQQLSMGVLIVGFAALGAAAGRANAKEHNAHVKQTTEAKQWSTRVDEGDLARGDAAERSV